MVDNLNYRLKFLEKFSELENLAQKNGIILPDLVRVDKLNLKFEGLSNNYLDYAEASKLKDVLGENEDFFGFKNFHSNFDEICGLGIMALDYVTKMKYPQNKPKRIFKGLDLLFYIRGTSEPNSEEILDEISSWYHRRSKIPTIVHEGKKENSEGFWRIFSEFEYNV